MSAQPAFLGNEAVVGRLEAKVRAGRLPHALIFSGPEGVGKRTCALRIIQSLQCTEHTVSPPCGTCVPCLKIQHGTHPDVSLIGVEGDASQIKIDQIRRLRESLQLRPIEGTVRACLIDPAERLTPGAANALLKVLEEPPPGTHFFLIAGNADGLLVTIRSRCQVYHFAPLPLDSLHALGITDPLVARWTRGSIGRAQLTDPAELREDRNQMLGFLEGGLSGDPRALARLIGVKLAPSREAYPEMIRAACFLISDLLCIKLGMEDRLVNIDVRDRLSALAASVEIDNLIEAANQLRLIEANLKYYINNQLMTDALLASLIPDNTKY